MVNFLSANDMDGQDPSLKGSCYHFHGKIRTYLPLVCNGVAKYI